MGSRKGVKFSWEHTIQISDHWLLLVMVWVINCTFGVDLSRWIFFWFVRMSCHWAQVWHSPHVPPHYLACHCSSFCFTSVSGCQVRYFSPLFLLNIRAKAGGIKWPWECNTTWWLTSCAMGFMCLAILNKCSGLLKTCGGKSCNGLIKFISSDIDAFQMETSTLTLLRSGEQFPCGKTTSGKSKFFLVGT